MSKVIAPPNTRTGHNVFCVKRSQQRLCSPQRTHAELLLLLLLEFKIHEEDNIALIAMHLH